MGIYVMPRAKRDFDFVVYLREEDCKFDSAFKEDYYCDIDAIREAVIIKVFFNIIDHESGYKTDFVILKINAFRQEKFKRRQAVDPWGKSICGY